MTRRLERALKGAVTVTQAAYDEPGEEAERELAEGREVLRAELVRLGEDNGVALDFSPESLKLLEKWYFALCLAEGFEEIGVTRETFETAMGFYKGFVFIENAPDYQWIAEKDHSENRRFRVGVRRRLFTLMIGRESRLHELRHNKRRESIYRQFKRLTE